MTEQTLGFLVVMKIGKNVTSFFFSKAEYYVGDENGNKVLIKVDYRNSKFAFRILQRRSVGIVVLKNEAGKFAQDLLKRKSKVNFAAKN